MQQPCLKEISKVKDVRRQTLGLIHGLEQVDLDKSPSPGVWSVGEVLDHLIRTDTVYYKEINALFLLKASGKRPYIQRSFSDIDASILFIPKMLLPLAEIPFNVMNIFLPRAVRNFIITSRLLPAQAPEIAKPRPGRSLEALTDELAAGPDKLEVLIGSQPDIDPGKFIHYHPLLGENNLLDLLRFLTNHEEVHQKQIRELLGTLRVEKR